LQDNTFTEADVKYSLYTVIQYHLNPFISIIKKVGKYQVQYGLIHTVIDIRIATTTKNFFVMSIPFYSIS